MKYDDEQQKTEVQPLLQLILPISRTLVTFLLFAFGRTCVQRK
jgi:hypothetical protein